MMIFRLLIMTITGEDVLLLIKFMGKLWGFLAVWHFSIMLMK